MSFDHKEIILHTYLIDDIGEKTIALISSSYSDIKNFYNYSVKDFLRLGVSEKKAYLLVEGLKNKNLLNDYKKLLEKNKCQYLTPLDFQYPNLLKTLEVYPPVLFYQTERNDFNYNDYLSIALVSSRKTNIYGKKVIYKLIEGLPNDKLIIVSGGAIGGDTFVHDACLYHKIKTIAYIGSGLKQWYPYSNKELFKKIISQGGLIMSHFLLPTQPTKMTFPIRNNIIAAMTAATIVIQAGEKSGTLITANCALEHGRIVGAVPGDIEDELMIESHNLLKNGAFVITSSKDILSMLGFSVEDLSLSLNFSYSNKLESLSLIEKNIFQLCVKPKSIYELVLLSNLSYDELQLVLYNLLNKKLITQDFMSNWVSCF